MKSLSEISINKLSTENLIYILKHFDLPKNTRNYIIKKIKNTKKIKPRNARNCKNMGISGNAINTMCYKTNFRNIPNITEFEKNLIRMRNLHTYAKLLVSRKNYNALPQYIKHFNYNKNYSHPTVFQRSSKYIKMAVKERLPTNFVNKVFVRENVPDQIMIKVYRKYPISYFF